MFEWLNYHFLSLICFAMALGMIAQFLWSNASGVLNMSPSEVPRIQLPDEWFVNVGMAVGREVNRLNVANNRFSGWIPRPLQNINLQTCTPASPWSPTHHKSADKGKASEISSSGNGSFGLSAGAIIGIILDVIVVVALIGFVIFKRRIRRRPPSDVEKVDINKPFVAAAASNDMQANEEPDRETWITNTSMP
ncbi:Reticulon-like protein B8 [Bienertia sinuspersici]